MVLFFFCLHLLLGFIVSSTCQHETHHFERLRSTFRRNIPSVASQTLQQHSLWTQRRGMDPLRYHREDEEGLFHRVAGEGEIPVKREKRQRNGGIIYCVDLSKVSDNVITVPARNGHHCPSVLDASAQRSSSSFSPSLSAGSEGSSEPEQLPPSPGLQSVPSLIGNLSGGSQ